MFGNVLTTSDRRSQLAQALATRAPATSARGHCRPFGATVQPGGVNFAIFSRNAQRVTLLLFREGQEELPFAEFELDPSLNKTGDVWHIFAHELGLDVFHARRVVLPDKPKAGHR